MDVTKLVDSIIEDKIQIKDLDMQQMEAIIDFMREHLAIIEDSELSETLLMYVDAIELAAEERFVNQAAGAWENTIESSVARGNSYFELENYTLQ